MIITKTPLRISFAGGGTDLPKYYLNSDKPGRVFSGAIDKYVYIMLNRKFDDKIRVSYSKTEIVNSVEEIEHDIVRNAMQMFNMAGGWEIVSVADIPGTGSGLGSSSAFAVGLLNAITVMLAGSGSRPTQYQLAEMACKLEIELCGKPIGKQDQYASAMGGMNMMEFNKDENVELRRIWNYKTRQLLAENLMLFYLGPRKEKDILRVQNELMDDEKREVMSGMAFLAENLFLDVRNGYLGNFGEVMDINWEYKRNLAPGITNDKIQEIYTNAMKAGALGGKVLGQGGGGFMLFYVFPHDQETVHKAIGLQHVPFEFVHTGSEVIYAS